MLRFFIGLKQTLLRVCAGGLGIRTRVTRRSQAQPGDPGRLDTSEFFEQARRPTLTLTRGHHYDRAAVWAQIRLPLACAVPGCKPVVTHYACACNVCRCKAATCELSSLHRVSFILRAWAELTCGTAQVYDVAGRPEPRVKASQCFTKYRWRPEAEAGAGGAAIVATQVWLLASASACKHADVSPSTQQSHGFFRLMASYYVHRTQVVSDFLTPYDGEMLMMRAQNNPVTVYSYRMSFRRPAAPSGPTPVGV